MPALLAGLGSVGPGSSVTAAKTGTQPVKNKTANVEISVYPLSLDVSDLVFE